MNMPGGFQFGAVRAMRWIAMMGLAMVSACTSAVNPHQAAEVENIRASNVIPKTTPKAMIAGFRRYCHDNIRDLTILPAKLNADDYVEIKAPGAFRTFIVDTKQPAVSFKNDSKAAHCFVAAEARTGQDNAVDRFVAANLPNARAIDPATSDFPVDKAWLLPGLAPTLIYLRRFGSIHGTPRVALGIIQQ